MARKAAKTKPARKAPAKRTKKSKPKTKAKAARGAKPIGDALAGALADAAAAMVAPSPVAPGRGRPSLYTPELAEFILGEMSIGRTLTDICSEASAVLEDGSSVALPAYRTVKRWALLNEEFRPLYARAREEQAHAFFEQTIDIADDGRRDYKMLEDKDGNEYVGLDHDHIQRSKLRVDTRKWAAAKLCPRLYGDRLKLDLPADPLDGKTDDQLREHAAALVAKLAAAGISIGGGSDRVAEGISADPG